MSLQTKRQICALLRYHQESIKVNIVPVQQQVGGVDCGFFTVAFIQYILSGKKNPNNVSFMESSMRNHDLKCLKRNNLEIFLRSENCAKRSEEKIIELAIYCSCRQIGVESDKNIFEK